MHSSSSQAPIAPGDLLASKYRVGEVLGAGGMGVVVAATHIDLEQRVALKFLLPGAAARPELVERFVREARASVRLKSPHVAKTLDVGRLEDGSPYIVMELLEGRALDAELEAAGPLPIADAASYVLQACDALAEAHALGIVHRDLKPGNLFLSRGLDGRAQVKILDFGISKIVGEAAPSSLTQTDAIFGSPAYMSPEQMRASKDVDSRADIWAVGVILFELLTGRIPFEASTAMELCMKVAQDEPPPPRSLRPDLPAALDGLIVGCLAKDRQARFQDVGALAAALAPFAHPRDQPIAARIGDVLGERAHSLLATAPKLAPQSDHEAAALSGGGATEPSLPPRRREGFIVPVLGVVALVSIALAGGLYAFGRSRKSVHAAHDAEPVDSPSVPFPAVTASAAPPSIVSATANVNATNVSATIAPSALPPPRLGRASPRGSPPPATSTSAVVTAATPPAPRPTSPDGGRFLEVRE